MKEGRKVEEGRGRKVTKSEKEGRRVKVKKGEGSEGRKEGSEGRK